MGYRLPSAVAVVDNYSLTHSAPRMFACIVPQALDVIKHCYSPARFTHTFLMFMELQLSRVLNQNGY